MFDRFLAVLRWLARWGCVGMLCSGVLSAWAQSRPAAEMYLQHCASCHGEQRIGLMGPALLPESLERLRPSEAVKVITHGRAATQMPAFSAALSPDDIKSLSQFIYTPLTPAPQWSDADIRQSRVQPSATAALQERPLWSADPMNLFVVRSEEHTSELQSH